MTTFKYFEDRARVLGRWRANARVQHPQPGMEMTKVEAFMANYFMVELCCYGSSMACFSPGLQISVTLLVKVTPGKGYGQTALINGRNSAHDFDQCKA